MSYKIDNKKEAKSMIENELNEMAGMNKENVGGYLVLYTLCRKMVRECIEIDKYDSRARKIFNRMGLEVLF